jgi:hypothetical protein
MEMRQQAKKIFKFILKHRWETKILHKKIF